VLCLICSERTLQPVLKAVRVASAWTIAHHAVLKLRSAEIVAVWYYRADVL
jgi:hypothetical protein